MQQNQIRNILVIAYFTAHECGPLRATIGRVWVVEALPTSHITDMQYYGGTLN